MSADILIQKYSQALFAATEENNKTEVVAKELEQVTQIFSQQDSKVFFESPFNSTDTKTMVAKSALEGKRSCWESPSLALKALIEWR